MYQNVRGLNTKLFNVYRKSVGCDYDVIAFTESWLNSDVHDSEIFCNDYQVYRKDRYSKNDKDKGKKGGGVLIAVLSSISSDCFVFSGNTTVEFICVRLIFENRHVFITCSYVPPDSGLEVYLKHTELISEVASKLSTRDSLIVLGDFNLPAVSWTFCPDIGQLMPFSCSNVMNPFFDILFELCLVQFNNVPNILNRYLDLVFSNTPFASLTRSLPFVCPEDSYHPTLLICLDISEFSVKPSAFSSEMQRFNFHKANFQLLKDCLRTSIWPNISNSLDFSISSFYDVLYSGFSVAVPLIDEKSVVSGPPWFTKELRRLRNVKSRLFKKYKDKGSPINYEKYSVARHRYSVLNQRCYSDYVCRMKAKFRVNPKSFYSFVNSKRKISGFPTSMKFNNIELSDTAGISDLFADFFQGTYSLSSLSHNYPYKLDAFNVISDFIITEDDVLKGLLNLKFSNSPGPDGVPSSILKMCAHELYIPLTEIFNCSLRLGHFPSCWRGSYIIPLHKNGNRRCVENYRGIAKLSFIPKLFEKIVTERLIHMAGNLVSPYQHGFLKGKSTSTNLLELCNHVFHAFTVGCQTDVIYTDFSKAFDTVDHELLLLKLDSLGFPPRLLKWISSYLKDRTQRVLFKNQMSKEIFVTSGVPQGSHLGPILFVLYLNDLPSIINFSKILMYADDVKLFLSLNKVSDCSLLEHDLENLCEWCSANNMSLNLKKCKKLSFYRSKLIHYDYYIGSHKLENVSSFDDLGVILDRKLDFNLHVTTCVNKAKSLLGFMKRWSKEFNDPYVTKNLYTSLVRPVLEYASVVWSPNYGCHIDSIESVQKQFLLFALRGLGWKTFEKLPPYEHRLKLINLPTLRRRRLMLGVTFMTKLINGEINSISLLGDIRFNVPNRVTRNYVPLKLSFCRYNYEEFNPFHCLCTQFNELYNLFSISDPISKIKLSLLREI